MWDEPNVKLKCLKHVQRNHKEC